MVGRGSSFQRSTNSHSEKKEKTNSMSYPPEQSSTVWWVFFECHSLRKTEEFLSPRSPNSCCFSPICSHIKALNSSPASGIHHRAKDATGKCTHHSNWTLLYKHIHIFTLSAPSKMDICELQNPSKCFQGLILVRSFASIFMYWAEMPQPLQSSNG